VSSSSARVQHRRSFLYLATLNLNTGALTPVPGITFTAKGLVFVAGAEGGNSEDGDSND